MKLGTKGLFLSLVVFSQAAFAAIYECSAPGMCVGENVTRKMVVFTEQPNVPAARVRAKFLADETCRREYGNNSSFNRNAADFVCRVLAQDTVFDM